MTSPTSLDGRVAYVTGSTRGIGNAIARTLAEAGATVAVNGHRSEAAVAALAEELTQQHGRPALALFADQREAADINGAYDRIFKTFGRLDVLVNNAGTVDDALLGMIREDSITDTFSVHAFAAVRNTQLASRLMRRSGGGSVINLASIMGVQGNAGEVVYAGAKAAVIGITRSAAKELAPVGIRVNAIAPGFIDTDLTRVLSPAIHAERLSQVGMGRIGQPQDVANVALFLASDLSQYVTGQIIGVDGAMVI